MRTNHHYLHYELIITITNIYKDWNKTNLLCRPWSALSSDVNVINNKIHNHILFWQVVCYLLFTCEWCQLKQGQIRMLILFTQTFRWSLQSDILVHNHSFWADSLNSDCSPGPLIIQAHLSTQRGRLRAFLSHASGFLSHEHQDMVGGGGGSMRTSSWHRVRMQTGQTLPTHQLEALLILRQSLMSLKQYCHS